MSGWFWDRDGSSAQKGMIDAINRSQAVIEFELDGTIVNANDNFLATMGYRLDEIRGKHHRMFVDPAYANSPEYLEFWKHLAVGEFHSGEFRRLGKGGREVWLHADYHPIFDRSGKPRKVVKFASDITAQKNQSADATGKVNAISRAQAMIEFALDGTILDANENFLAAMGYRLDEIRGRHHRMFVPATEAASI